MDPEVLPVAAMGLAVDVVDHPLPVVHPGLVLHQVAPVVVHPGPALHQVVPVVVHPGPALHQVAPVVVHPGPALHQVAPDVVHPGHAHLPVAPDVVHPGHAHLPVVQDPALAALAPADLAPFLACDDIEGNPNPWVQVEHRRPPRQQGAHPVAPIDNTGDVDGLGEQGVDEFEDAFWLTKIRQYRVSRRSTKSHTRALVGVRSGPGVFVFNY